MARKKKATETKKKEPVKSELVQEPDTDIEKPISWDGPRKAVGRYTKGKYIQKDGRYIYDVRCEDDGTLIGTISFGTIKPQHDPADSGLICGECSKKRLAAAEEQG